MESAALLELSQYFGSSQTNFCSIVYCFSNCFIVTNVCRRHYYFIITVYYEFMKKSLFKKKCMYSLCKSTYQLNWVCIYIVKENCYNFLNVAMMFKWASTVRLPLHIFYWIHDYFFKRKMCEHGFKFTILFNKLKWIYRYSVHVSSAVGRQENL